LPSHIDRARASVAVSVEGGALQTIQVVQVHWLRLEWTLVVLVITLAIALVSEGTVGVWRLRVPLDAKDSGDSLTAFLHTRVALIDKLRVVTSSSSIRDWLLWCRVGSSVDRVL